MQNEVLEENPQLDIAVFAVWFNMVASDKRSRWPAGLLSDSRVTHLWDEGRLLGSWYGAQSEETQDGETIVWDAYFLYRRDARWDGEPGGLESWGYPIVKARDALRRDLLEVARKAAGEGGGE